MQLEEITRGFFRRATLRDQVFQAEELYKALGLMEDADDLYDEESESMYVLSDATSIGPVEELGYASAYVLGLQQASFDISGLRSTAREIDADHFNAVNALIKGDITQVSTGYMATFFTQEDIDVLRTPLAENKLQQAPRIVFETIMFPFREGADLVSELFGTDGKGWVGVNEAYLNPPVSTEQVIHPEKYFAGELPVITTAPDISADMGKGWVEVSNNTMGELILRIYLEEHLDNIPAADAAAGWAGDGYSLLSGPAGERLLTAVIRWDTVKEGTEFFDNFRVFGCRRPAIMSG